MGKHGQDSKNKTRTKRFKIIDNYKIISKLTPLPKDKTRQKIFAKSHANVFHWE